MSQVKVGILGATGMVGQRFVQLLENHPQFVIKALGASPRSAGKTYREAVNWKLSTPIPTAVADVVVALCKPEEFIKQCDIVFSGLDSSVAGPIEDAFAKAEMPVFSNSKNHRMDKDVPILIPYVNASHIDIIKKQRENKGYKKGFIVTNANCSTTGLAIALAPIHQKYGIDKCLVFTMQAISGGGYPGVSSMDIHDNVVPYIGSEEGKLVIETRKILGPCKDNAFVDAEITVSAHCNRVSVLDGHTECVSLKLSKPATPEDIKKLLSEYTEPTVAKLHSCPDKMIIVREEQDRPQPRLDRNAGNGNTVTVGRVRKCEIFDIKMVLLSHNTVIGAAGGSILNAELAVQRGYI